MVIKNFIKKRDDFIECGHTIDEIIFAMNAKELNYLVLVQKGKPHGIITERDVLQLLYQKHFSSQASCCSICSRNLIKANGDRSLEYSLGLMIEERIRRLVIIDSDGFYLGVVEQEDIVYHFEAEILNARAKIKDFSHTTSKAVTLNENVKTKRAI
jgi:predicted transcriptional regulator